MSNKLVWCVHLDDIHNNQLVHVASSEQKAREWMSENFELLDDTDVDQQEPLSRFNLTPCEVNGEPRSDEEVHYDWEDFEKGDYVPKFMEDVDKSQDRLWTTTVMLVLEILEQERRITADMLSNYLNYAPWVSKQIIDRMVQETFLQHYEGEYFTATDIASAIPV